MRWHLHVDADLHLREPMWTLLDGLCMPAFADTVIQGSKTSVNVLTEWSYRTWFVRQTAVRRSGSLHSMTRTSCGLHSELQECFSLIEDVFESLYFKGCGKGASEFGHHALYLPRNHNFFLATHNILSQQPFDRNLFTSTTTNQKCPT